MFLHVLDELLEKFNKFSPLFIVDSVPEDKISQHMKDYQMRTGKKIIRGTKKLLGVNIASKILLFFKPTIKWYLNMD